MNGVEGGISEAVRQALCLKHNEAPKLHPGSFQMPKFELYNSNKHW